MTTTTGLRAVITGAGSGLGRALALDLAARGARAVLADIDLAGAGDTAEMVRAQGGEAWAVACDVADPDQVADLAARAGERLGGVDFVANNAGVAVSGPFQDISLDDWRWIVDINLWGVIHGCHAFVPGMLERGRGYVLNVASAAGLLCTGYMSPYNVTKAGVVALTETLYMEAKPRGVHVTVLCPTFFRTNIADASRGPGGSKLRDVVLGRMERSRVQAPEVARAAVDATLRGELYAVPMRDGRALWWIKRLLARRFYDLAAGPYRALLPGFE